MGDGSKALTEVAGRPMINHVLEQFMTAKIQHVLVTVRPEDDKLKRHLRRMCAYDFQSLSTLEVSAAVGTGGATRALTRAIGSKAHLLSTVDFVGPPGVAARLLGESNRRSAAAAVMLATPLQRDSKPAWIDIDQDGQVLRFGRDLSPTAHVYGNMRWMSAAGAQALRRLPSRGCVERDSVLINRLIAASHQRVEAFVTNVVFDVDDTVDLQMAESWLNETADTDVWGATSSKSRHSRPVARVAGHVR